MTDHLQLLRDLQEVKDEQNRLGRIIIGTRVKIATLIGLDATATWDDIVNTLKERSNGT